MFEECLPVYAFNLAACRRLLEGIDDAAMTRRHAGADNRAAAGNPPLWVLGHLAIATDYAARVLGLPTVCPESWHRDFGPGSDPGLLGAGAAARAELLVALSAGHARVVSALPGATAAAVSGPHGVPWLEWSPLKTAGDVVVHLMTSHEAFHLGQLSAWRRHSGLGFAV